MLADGISDPYCRFITPGELAGMKKYDVTGVGLNLGTAEEFERKTGKELPASGAERDATGVSGRRGLQGPEGLRSSTISSDKGLVVKP